MEAEILAAITKAQNEQLKQENEQLKLQLKEFKRLIFGSKSERFVPSTPTDSQIDLFTGTSAKDQEQLKQQQISYTRKVPSKKKQKPVRSELPAHLPRVEEIIEPSSIDPGAKKIGEEITEVLEYNPANIYVRKIIRPKYALADNSNVVIADLPSLPLPRSNAGAGMLAHISVSKFIDHLPFYRQIQMFKRQKLYISQSTMSDWFSSMCKVLELLYEELKKEVLENTDYLQADESPIGVQDSHKKGALHNGYMWLFRNPKNKLVLFTYNKGRSREAPEEILDNFTGTLQTDGYKVYQVLRTQGEITLMGCMAHARRYFDKAVSNDKQRAEHVLALMQKLYVIERKAKERQVNDATKRRYRQLCAKPILEKLELWMKESSFKVLPKSAIGKAIAYTQNIYPSLKRYIEDGKYEIDNNNIENAVRPLALGRKNYLFAGSHQSAQNIAMMYSFFASCKANEVNPFHWLKDVLSKMPDQKNDNIKQFLPNYWAKQNLN